MRAVNVSAETRLDRVVFEAEQSRITAICGPNGAGKSTLLTILAGLLSPDSGNVLLDDTNLTEMTPNSRARTIGYLPQDGEVAWDLRVEALVALGRLPWRGRDGSPEADVAAVDRALTALDLTDLRHCPVSRLSGGERARALMARVLAGEPEWILADEPFAALDLAHQLTLLAVLRKQAEAGAGVIMVLHDLALAMNHADHVVVLGEGRLAAQGPPEAALSRDVIRSVWGVEAEWLGAPGARALAVR